MTIQRLWGWLAACALILSACNLSFDVANGGGSSGSVRFDEVGRVTRVIDGDTIDVEINGVVQRVRYVGVNTPERDEVCYQQAADFNRQLVSGQTIGLVRDRTNTDRFDRLLRYVYVGETFVNLELVRAGFAEAVLYEPDDRHWQTFVDLERAAAAAGLGCHPTGIFNDGSFTR
ncbi:thermonuclease family protein [Aggregatilineales bacterium SYSU G02658]